MVDAKKDSKKAPQSSLAAPPAPDATPDATPATAPAVTQGATDATPATAPAVTDATPASAPPVETEEARMKRDLDESRASIASLLVAMSAAAQASDIAKVTELSKEISEKQAHAVALDVALTSRTFAPSVASLVKGAIEAGTFKVPQVGGRLVVQLTFEGSTLTSAVPVTIDSIATAKRAAMSGAPVTQARSNLRAAQVDPRAPSAGFRREYTSQGVCWSIVSLGDGQCRATASGKSDLEGSLNKVMLSICGNPVNAYKALGLGEAGTKWADATPGVWVKA